MAITRKLREIHVTILDATGTVKCESSELVADDVEGTASGRVKNWNAPSVKAAAEALRDAIIAQAEQQGKPMVF